MAIYNPIKSFPQSTNRLLVIDWASLSYHLWHAMNSKLKTSTAMEFDPDLMTSEEELAIWRTSIVNRMIKYIRLFNPMDIVIALEGKNVWRTSVVKDYYSENAIVSYDDKGYYVRYDNFLYQVRKSSSGFQVTKLDIKEDGELALLPNAAPLGTYPQRVQDMLWNMFLANGTTPLLPVYKGKRKNQEWPFITDKKIWRDYKDEFGKAVAKMCRAYAIGKDDAEGDDVIYVACNYLKDKYNDIVLITGDSDMNQMLTIKNLKIYNHRSDDIVVCNNPEDYLELKILQGDSSDNVNGMALPNKKTQLGEGGATKLFESTSNVFELAKKDGWDKQYRRNQTLIDLHYIPTDIQRSLCEMIDSYKPILGNMKDIVSLRITDKIVENIMRMKDFGFYSLLDKEYATEHPDIYNPELMSDDNAYSSIDSLTKPNREFGSVSGVFVDPTGGDPF